MRKKSSMREECQKQNARSYNSGQQKRRTGVRLSRILAEWTGLEPATPGVTGRYSNRLNYHSLYCNETALEHSAKSETGGC
ncbi:protein of unknown function [Paraburkholderia dioscoreae]|uniref:Uncharacterized protein n=1 Tax=Paraburkholderia dioscoreae TaxID=2604047 RepID=A0A5Q4ZD18_9BURK|nr:protein of unknown function [Paraburkholderia dioscoreae]